MTDVLFFVNGLGLGNSTRCDAIIRELHQRGLSVAVGTSGNGLWYFENADHVERIMELKALKYSAKEGALSIRKTLADTGQLLATSRENAKRVGELIDEMKPKCVVTDSFYSVGPIRKRGIPLIALNNSDVVVESYLNRFAPPASVRAQFWVVEFGDYLFHRTFANIVISPNLDPSLPSRHPRYHRVPPIVRQGFNVVPSSGPAKHVVIMLSGSVFSSSFKLTQKSYDFRVSVIGRPHDGVSPIPDGVTYLGRVRDVRPIIEDADLMVINGGFSAVSEGYYLQKPLVVVPVPNHAEQWVNAATIRHLGVGEIGSEETLEADMLKAVKSLDRYRQGYVKNRPRMDGTSLAADLIIDCIKKT
jgi:uncharacterized protein (TIGR00661 family)